MAATLPITSPSNVEFNELGNTKTERKGLFAVTTEFVEDRWSEAAKAVYTGIDIANTAGWIPEDQKETWASARYHANLIKLTKAPGTLLKNTNELRNKTVELLNEGRSLKRGYDWVKAFNNLISPIHDIAEFFSKAILFIPMNVILKGVNGSSMVLGFSCIAVESLMTINNNQADIKTGKERQAEVTKGITSMLKLAWAVSLAVLGAFIVLSSFFAVVLPSVAFLAASASSVVFSILGYYHENLGTPK